MKIQLDSQITVDLREKINEHHNISYEKDADFKFPNNKNTVTASAYNCICATLDRISDLVQHCNSIEIEGQFGLCDFLNYSQSLIECITILGKIYKVEAPYKGVNKNDISVFQQAGLTGNGNDEKYFTYLRSLCSVHPVETSRHPEYQGDQAEWCPYISSGKHSMLVRFAPLSSELENADFVVTVYRNDVELSKYVPIHVDKLIEYVQKRYLHINDIIIAVEKYNSEIIERLRNKKIPLPEAFDDYILYLNSLQAAITERCGKNHSDKTKEWVCIFKAHFENEIMQNSLIKYQKALKQGISIIHKKLQNMEINHYFEEEPISYDRHFIKNGYALEKLSYLQQDFWRLSFEDAIILAENGGEPFENSRINNMLCMISYARENGAENGGLEDVARYIDSKYSTTNSEWARIQLKIIEPYFDNVVEFDYGLNDWYLHLQIEIAFWLISERS